MGSRILSHQLSNGLYVSGRPEQPKEKPPTMSSVAIPYTGGDIKKSGELGKMFDIPADNSRSRKSGPISSNPTRTGTLGVASYSGPVMPNSGTRSKNSSGPASSTGATGAGSSNRQRSNSGPLNKQSDSMKRSSGQQSGGTNVMARQNSGPLPLPATGLITSGPISSGPLSSSGVPRNVSGSMDSAGSAKMHNTSNAQNQAVININQEDDFSFKRTFPKPVLWAVILLFLMAFIAGGFILAAVHNAILLVVVLVLFGTVSALLFWNLCWGTGAIKRFISGYPDADLRVALDGQYVKISGIVTCGNVPLESSFEKVPRCVYTSTRLYEYRGWDSKPANSHHRSFTWGIRSMERHAVDFYISDFQSGLRALVKTGNGAKVIPYVDESVVLDVDPSKKDLSPEFLRWSSHRNLSSDDRIMRVKEGYVKEGSTVSVIGIIRRNENVIMIVPPPEPVSTGCQWANCVLPASADGIILRCEDTSKLDVVPV